MNNAQKLKTASNADLSNLNPVLSRRRADKAPSGSIGNARRAVYAKKKKKRRFKRALAIWLCLTALSITACVIITHMPEKQPDSEIKYKEELPYAYDAEIKRYAERFELEPEYISAVIYCESSFRPDAVSGADARGLMQILPSTAEWIARKLDEEYTEGDLFDPDTNIRYGSWYLGFLMDRYDGDKRCASAAYHAGQTTVDRWLEDPDYSKDGKTLAAMAYDSTATYVDRVLAAYAEYKILSDA